MCWMITHTFRHVDLGKIANGEAGEVEEVHPQEDPTYRQHLFALRYKPTSWPTYTQCCVGPLLTTVRQVKATDTG